VPNHTNGKISQISGLIPSSTNNTATRVGGNQSHAHIGTFYSRAQPCSGKRFFSIRYQLRKPGIRVGITVVLIILMAAAATWLEHVRGVDTVSHQQKIARRTHVRALAFAVFPKCESRVTTHSPAVCYLPRPSGPMHTPHRLPCGFRRALNRGDGTIANFTWQGAAGMLATAWQWAAESPLFRRGNSLAWFHGRDVPV
jgi:hypothetical protein